MRAAPCREHRPWRPGFWFRRGAHQGAWVKTYRRTLGGAFGALLPAMALAAALARPAAADDPAFLNLGAGYYDINDDEEAGEFRAEYWSDWRLLLFKPFVGVSATTDRAVYGYLGLRMDLYFGRRWMLIPSAAVGAYEDGDGKDLGHTIEFRTGAEIAYRFDDRSRLGIAFHHISNADLGDKNPGTEILTLNYAIPINKIIR